MIMKDTRTEEEIHENLHPVDSESINKEEKKEHTLGLFSTDKPSGSVTFTSKSEAIMFINSLMEAFKIETEELDW